MCDNFVIIRLGEKTRRLGEKFTSQRMRENEQARNCDHLGSVFFYVIPPCRVSCLCGIFRLPGIPQWPMKTHTMFTLHLNGIFILSRLAGMFSFRLAMTVYPVWRGSFSSCKQKQAAYPALTVYLPSTGVS